MILPILVYSACSSAPNKHSTERPSIPLDRIEASYDPLSDPQDRTVVANESATSRNEQSDARAFNWAEADSFFKAQRLQDSTFKIYRVQLFASQYYTEANYELQMAREVFADSVFIAYDLPYYKVMLGNCTTEDEGNGLLSMARSFGYYNSWLIESPPDSIYYRMHIAKDSAAAGDTLMLQTPEPKQ